VLDGLDVVYVAVRCPRCRACGLLYVFMAAAILVHHLDAHDVGGDGRIGERGCRLHGGGRLPCEDAGREE
jgi:hypothetical protein